MKIVVGIVGLMCVIQQSVWADVLPLPGSVQPAQVSQSLSESTAPPKQTVLPPMSPLPKQPLSPMEAAARKIKFKLTKIVFSGHRVYSDAQLKRLYQHQLNKTISVADLFGIVQDITNYYRNNGYIISRAILPPQRIKNGVVHVQILEGFIKQVDVRGEPHGAVCYVKALGHRIAASHPLKLKEMERYLLLANEIPATQVRAVLSPSKQTSGAADLTLVTQNRPVTGYVSYDDYGTRYIGPQQITINGGFNSFITSGDSMQVTFTKTPKGGELTFADINYNMPINDEGVRWLGGVTRAHTHPLFVLRPVQIDGLNDNYYTLLQYPAIRSREKSLTWQLGFNYLDTVVTALDEPLYTDHLRTLSLGGTYNFADHYAGANLVNADIRQGLPILGYTSSTTSNMTSRYGGRGNFTKVDWQLSRLQAVKGPVSLYGILRGQYAFNPLLAAEQFTFGGSQLGRGYDVAELIGDRGLAGGLEARYDWYVGRIVQLLEFYVFYDAGKIWNIKRLPGQIKSQSGTSTGVGARFSFTKFISGNLMYTQTLTKPVAAEQLIHQGRRPRIFFSLVAALG